jgi:hypothetical protein
MKDETSQVCNCKHHSYKHHGHHGNSNPIYGLGIIGALFYFLQSASGFTAIIIGIFKAVFWPAVLMFELLTYLQM